jgi:hypothetical protein
LPQYRGRLCNDALDDLGRAQDIADEIDGRHGAARNIVACRREIFLLDIRLSCRQLVLAAEPLGRERVLERAAWMDRRPGRAADDVEYAVCIVSSPRPSAPPPSLTSPTAIRMRR